MVERKLPEEVQQCTAIGYFCGVPLNKLTSEFRVSKATINAGIVQKYSKQWNDPLVEFYRIREKTHNAVHFYLSTNGESLALCEHIREKNIYASEFIIENTIIPQVQTIIKATGLETLFVEHQSSYERMINDLTQRTPRSITEGYVIPLLRSSYPEVSWERVRCEAISSIATKVKNGGLGISQRKIECIEELLSTLSEKEQQVMRIKYLNNEKTLPNVRVGEALGCTSENIRQLLQSIHNQFSTGPQKDHLSFIASLVTDHETKQYRDQQKKERWKSLVYYPVTEHVNEDFKRHPARYGVDYGVIKEVRIEHTNLSNRIKNCLQYESVHTVGDLLQKSEEDLLPIKSFGKICLTEIRTFLGRFKLHLRGEENPSILLRLGDWE